MIVDAQGRPLPPSDPRERLLFGVERAVAARLAEVCFGTDDAIWMLRRDVLGDEAGPRPASTCEGLSAWLPQEAPTP